MQRPWTRWPEGERGTKGLSARRRPGALRDIALRLSGASQPKRLGWLSVDLPRRLEGLGRDLICEQFGLTMSEFLADVEAGRR